MGRVVRGRGARKAVVSRGTSGTRTAAQGSDMEARESITGRSATAAPSTIRMESSASFDFGNPAASRG